MNRKSLLPKFSLWAVQLLLLILILFVLFFPNLLPGGISVERTIFTLVSCIIFVNLFQIYKTDSRLDRLSELAELIGKGNYNARSEDRGKDALGRLAFSVNAMAEQIGASVAQLETSQEQLEVSSAQLEKQNDELSLVIERQKKFGDFLSNISSIEINVITNEATKSLMDLGNCQVGLFYIYDSNKGELNCITRRSIDQSVLRSFSGSGAMEGLPGEVKRTGKWVSLEDIDAEALPEINLGFTQAKIRCLYAIPVIFQKRFLGVVILAGLRAMDASTRQVLKNQIDALANAISNAITYGAVQKQSILLEDANSDLLTAHKQKSEFVANMSHELRTPLNSIIGFSGILMKNRSGNLKKADLSRIEKVNRNGKHLLSLINDILDLSKVEAGRMDFVFEDTDLVIVLRDVVEMLQPQADAKAISLILESSDPEVRVETDGHKLRQILINLVGNAVKFTKEGSVAVRCAWVGGQREKVRLEVIDTGIGIRPENIDHIFQAFSQEDSSTSREFGGTGLGLTISKSMIELLGGTLTAHSEGNNRGSSFTIILPCVKTGAAPAPPPRKEKEAPFPPKASLEEKSKKPEKSPVAGVEVKPRGDGREIRPERKRKAPVVLRKLEPPSPLPRGSVAANSRLELKRVLPIEPGKRILIVDDDPDAREFIIQYVKELGADYRACGEPLKVVDMVKEYRPDLVTLDIMMPERNGWEVLSRIKADPEISDTSVVIVSMVADRSKAISLGAVDALTKPVVQEDFLACVRRTLNSDKVANRKILIVDDLEEYQELMKLWMDDSENEIRTAANGREALEVLENFHPDVIFLDLMMPVMDGLSFLQEFRSNDKYAGIPVIVVTAKNLTLEERKFLESRSEKILRKGEEIFN